MSSINFKIDETKCVKCGACVRDCPVHIIEATDGIPQIRTEKEKNCIHCQHCLAVCPTAAVSVLGKLPEKSIALKNLTLPSGEQMKNLFYTRRSIRQYKKENVDKALIQELLQILANAPTGCNAQGLTFTVVDDIETMNVLREKTVETIAKTRTSYPIPRFVAIPAIAYRRAKIDEFFRGAPHLLIVTADTKRSTCPVQDIAAALAYFDLLAQSYGLGTTWCGYLQIITDIIPEVKDLFKIPRATPYYAMLFGKPSVKYMRGVQRDDGAKTESFVL